MATTPQADAKLSHRKGGPLRLRERRLSVVRRDSDFQCAIRQATSGGGARVRRLWLADTDEGRPGILCEIVRLPHREFVFGFDPRAMVILRTGGDVPFDTVETLRQAFGLTASEAQIALQLANGVDRDVIAADRGTSAHTLTTQIKAILAKSGAGREAHLVSLISRLLR